MNFNLTLLVQLFQIWILLRVVHRLIVVPLEDFLKKEEDASLQLSKELAEVEGVLSLAQQERQAVEEQFAEFVNKSEIVSIASSQQESLVLKPAQSAKLDDHKTKPIKDVTDQEVRELAKTVIDGLS